MSDKNVFKILCVGDIVGRGGRNHFKKVLPEFRVKNDISCVVANAENASGGVGLNAKCAGELIEAGADVLTLGDHTWKHKDIENYFADNSNCIRPANYPKPASGQGQTIWTSKCGVKVGVMNLLGRVFTGQLVECPFSKADSILEEKLGECDIRICDFHAEATSEKISMGRYLAGRCSLVFGTHTHVQTADEQILSDYTGYISDLGMTGSHAGVIGMDYEVAIKRFVTGRPAAYKSAKEEYLLKGVVASFSLNDGSCESIERVSV